MSLELLEAIDLARNVVQLIARFSKRKTGDYLTAERSRFKMIKQLRRMIIMCWCPLLDVEWYERQRSGNDQKKAN